MKTMHQILSWWKSAQLFPCYMNQLLNEFFKWNKLYYKHFVIFSYGWILDFLGIKFGGFLNFKFSTDLQTLNFK